MTRLDESAVGDPFADLPPEPERTPLAVLHVWGPPTP